MSWTRLMKTSWTRLIYASLPVSSLSRGGWWWSWRFEGWSLSDDLDLCIRLELRVLGGVRVLLSVSVSGSLWERSDGAQKLPVSKRRPSCSIHLERSISYVNCNQIKRWVEQGSWRRVEPGSYNISECNKYVGILQSSQVSDQSP